MDGLALDCEQMDRKPLDDAGVVGVALDGKQMDRKPVDRQSLDRKPVDSVTVDFRPVGVAELGLMQCGRVIRRGSSAA